jgi:hypothetical protein
MICEAVNPDNNGHVKTCAKCGETKSVNEFQIRKNSKVGYYSRCRPCIYAYQKTLNSRQKRQVLEKKCCSCGHTKSRDQFYISNRESDGLTHRCKACDQKYLKTRKSKLKINVDFKSCNVCDEKKPILDYASDSYSKDGHRKTCKDCQSLYDRNWLTENYEKALAKNANRRAKKLNATPKWLTKEHIIEIDFIYWFAKSIKGLHGKTYVVDHVHPLVGRNFNGLHVPWNLQIMSSSENAKKSNKPPASDADMFWPYTMKQLEGKNGA